MSQELISLAPKTYLWAPELLEYSRKPYTNSLDRQAEARIMRIAADRAGLWRSYPDLDDLALSIICAKGSRSSRVPSLFHACRYSRTLSKKAYTLWPCMHFPQLISLPWMSRELRDV
jgi:hypothetical protein